MKLLGNIIWLATGGLITAFMYWAAGVVMCVTIIGIPFGLQHLKMALLAVVPFGKKIV